MTVSNKCLMTWKWYPKPGFTFNPGIRFTILFLIHNFPSFHQISSGDWVELWVTDDDWMDARQSSWHDSRRVPESNSSGFRVLSIRLIKCYSQHQLRYTLVWIKTKFWWKNVIMWRKKKTFPIKVNIGCVFFKLDPSGHQRKCRKHWSPQCRPVTDISLYPVRRLTNKGHHSVASWEM